MRINRSLFGLTLILSLALQAGVRAGIPMNTNDVGEYGVYALAAKNKAKAKVKPAPEKNFKTIYQERGTEIDNFVYEIFDPNAKDPLADLGLVEMETPQRTWRWWVTSGAAVLLGAGAAGYFLYLMQPEKSFVKFSDSTLKTNGP